YFSDHPNGRRKALQAARAYRGKLLSRLPPPKKIRTVEKRNTTGVIGVYRQGIPVKVGEMVCPIHSEWPNTDATRSGASLPVNLYGTKMPLNWRCTVVARDCAPLVSQPLIFRCGLTLG